MANFGEHETRRARKPHQCDWCGDGIAVGETYLHWRGLTDGEIGTYRNHPECQDAADRAIQEQRLRHDEWPFAPDVTGHKRGHTYDEAEDCRDGKPCVALAWKAQS